MFKRGSIIFLLLVVVMAFSCIQIGAVAATKIRVLSFSGALADALDPMIEAYQKKSGIQIEVVKLDYDALYDKALSLMKGQSSEFDLLMLDDSWFPSMAAEGHFVALDQKFGYKSDADIYPVARDGGVWPPPYGLVPPTEKNKARHTYGVPVVGDLILFIARKDIIKQKGFALPETIDEMLAIAKATYDPKNNMWGFVDRGQKSNPIGADSLPLFWCMGADFFDSKWNTIIDNPAGLKAAKTLFELYKYGPPGSASYNTSEQGMEFLSGRAVMGYTWPGDLSKDLENPEISKAAGKLAWMLPPALKKGGKHTTMLGEWLMGMPRYSKNQKAAYDFLNWFMAKPQALKYAQLGGMPVRKSILTDTALVAKRPWYPAQAAAFAAPAVWRARTPYYFQIEEIFGTELNKALQVKFLPTKPSRSRLRR